MKETYFNKTGYTNPSQNPVIKHIKILKKTYTIDEFIKKANVIHNNFYDYSKVNYRGCLIPIIITCPKHGDFIQKPYTHLAGCGCPTCRKSKGELAITKYLMSKHIDFITQYRFKDCKDKKPLPFDFYLPKYNICIEYQGAQHYQDYFFIKRYKNDDEAKRAFELQKKHDEIKKEYCKNNNIHLIEIKYSHDVSHVLDSFFANL